LETILDWLLGCDVEEECDLDVEEDCDVMLKKEEDVRSVPPGIHA
jgi:hypothetical protein